MMCPKCFAPFIDGIEICSDCGTKLVPDFEIEAEKEEKEFGFIANENNEPEFLAHISDGMEVERVVEMLEAHNIPVLVKCPNVIGQLLFPGIRKNADLYVPRAAIPDAINLLSSEEEGDVEEEISEI